MARHSSTSPATRPRPYVPESAIIRHNESEPELYVRMSDDSLLGAGIVKSTILMFERSPLLYRKGNLVAVQTPDGFFVKFIHPKERGTVLLKGASPGCKARRYRLDQIRVEGVIPQSTDRYVPAQYGYAEHGRGA